MGFYERIDARGVRKPGVSFLLSRRAHLLTTHEVGGGIACGNRALCEADAAPAGAFGQCHPLLRVLSSSTQSAMCFASSSKQLFPFWKQLADCLHKPATGSFVAERVSQFTTPFSFSQKKQKSKNERTVRTNGNLSS